MEVAEQLRAAGLRRTEARAAILSALQAEARPVTPQFLSERLPSVDRVTIYRNLHSLEAAGLVHRVQGLDGAWRYCAHEQEPGRCPGGHPHLLCLRCGEMRCLVEQSLSWVEVPEGFEVQGKQYVVYGLCARCASGKGR